MHNVIKFNTGARRIYIRFYKGLCVFGAGHGSSMEWLEKMGQKYAVVKLLSNQGFPTLMGKLLRWTKEGEIDLNLPASLETHLGGYIGSNYNPMFLDVCGSCSSVHAFTPC